ncbi:MAG TPA: reverse transcriptase domain-containing protein [Fimbriiglobus sp.]|nr:reverse transcriptase domain-containing protein [Fimbriiglobus sp.]
MAFWDFLSKLLGGEKKPTPGTAAVPAASPSPVERASESAESPPTSVARAAGTAAVPGKAPPPGTQPGDFLPIARDDLLKQGEEVRRTTGWMWFGRRDIIPPATDPRTKLIDRGMYTQGFLTPEELAEMHRVGEEWDRHANRLHHIQVKAGQSAEAAVEADRAARAAVKAQKKAEAAERKRKHAEAVAHRKATDINFVGKGVSALLNDRTSDADKLTAARLPVLHTPADLAAALGLSIPRLRWLCYHTEAATRIHYVQFEVPKRSGGTRTLSAPHTTLATVQDWVLGSILAKLPTEEPAHGFVPGRSTLTNAAPHAGKDVVVNLDLEGFFPSIGFARVRHLFRRLGYSGAVATLLALVCTECPRKRVVYAGTPYFVATGPRGLPQGACTSPALSNQIARKLDRRFVGLAAKLGLTYTRYADDLTFSAGPGFREKVGYLIARVRHVAEDEGFAVNPKKTRVQRPESRQSVTGLVVNAAPAVPRDMVKRVRAILHRAKTEGLAAQNRDGHPNFRGWVEGMIAYIGMARPDVGQKLRAAFDEVSRS